MSFSTEWINSIDNQGLKVLRSIRKFFLSRIVCLNHNFIIFGGLDYFRCIFFWRIA
ncbi:hypothetical protein Gogos_009552 [Gossypium gossypioides]|uniref:Uncharacterized protein n=1 Tax=Gossypium gossypioides TaxID=34282 RepID=A0A7J9CF35_GOSGO|nr:hypothetical protein [Gossypium gossypioides]